jgi:tetratricopeptide (TPR) repeat protein
MARYIADILLNIDDQHIIEAERWIMKAIEADNNYGMTFHLGWDYALYAELLKRKGDQSKAKENLNKAIEIYKECGADGGVEKAEKELA